MVDEAHLIQLWGISIGRKTAFRKDFAKLGKTRFMFPKASILAVSATLPRETLDPMLTVLRFGDNPLMVLSEGTLATNLQIERLVHGNVPRGELPFVHLLQILPRKGSCKAKVFVFFESVIKAKEACKYIQAAFQDKEAAFSYASDDSATMQNRNLSGFKEACREGEVKIMCTTEALATGLNLKGITHVIQVGMPKDAVSLIQRWGRGGRDLLGFAVVILLIPKQTYSKILKKISNWEKSRASVGDGVDLPQDGDVEMSERVVVEKELEPAGAKKVSKQRELNVSRDDQSTS